MEQLTTFFLGILAFNLATSLIIFAVIYFSRRKQRELSPLRAFTVFIGGWLAASLIMFVLYIVFAFAGVALENTQLESPLSIIVVIASMYVLFTWLSTKRVAIAA